MSRLVMSRLVVILKPATTMKMLILGILGIRFIMVVTNMTLELAKRLFVEADNFASGRVMYLNEDSEIRRLARDQYGIAHVMHLDRICTDIFHVIAVDAMSKESQ